MRTILLPTLTGIICLPFMVGVYMASTPYVALMLSVVPGLLFNVYLGNTLANLTLFLNR